MDAAAHEGEDRAGPRLPAGTRVAIFAGRKGNQVICEGVAAALGVAPDIRPLAPRRLFAAAAPFGPVDPLDRPRPPFPDIALASGRVAVPYLRDLKRRSPATFAVFLQDPRVGRSRFDLIWLPEHDRWRGPNAVVTLLSPHPLTPARLAAARAAPPPRIAAMPAPRVALLLGGDSRTHRFAPADMAALADIAAGLVAAGHSLMITPSRRTPAALLERLRVALAGAPAGRVWLWDGTGDNPYLPMLAAADAILVTADSANMVGEAAATGAPVHVYEPSGGSAKMTRFLDALVAAGAARRWSGALERWRCAPLDSTAEVAAAIARRYADFRAGAGRVTPK
ncbi:MAG: mitochondrial fission ELM1 family protein [Methylobacteriaceae bacterium]|nr:mitochondrial fission ELM1 family protein [Methylobacteriaceae bacterium]